MEERLRSEYKWLLDVNEMAFDPIDERRLIETIKGVNRYPDSGGKTLRTKLASLVRQTVKGAGWVEPDHLILGNGSDEVLKLILEGLLSQGDSILIPEPTFSEYERLAQITRTNVVKMAFDLEGFDACRLIESINRTKAKLIFLSNPNNPTGSFLSAQSIQRIANETEALIVVDEAYGDFAGESAISCIKGNPRIIIVRTLSKAYGLASLRIGFLIADQAVVSKLIPYKMTYNISGVSESIAIDVLRDIGFAKGYIKTMEKVRQNALDLLTKVKGITVFPSRANFVLIKIESERCYKTLYESLEAASMRVRWFNHLSDSEILLGCVRLTLTSDEDFMVFYRILIKSMEEERCDSNV
ncbi:MAG TPA: hypothetical protein DCS67_11300 [Clostridiales bacterium UBA8960]|nr:hypothetical protein [Clostridiales bacterium UBA8960]